MQEPKATKVYTLWGRMQDAVVFAAYVVAKVNFKERFGKRKPAGFVAGAVFDQNRTTQLKEEGWLFKDTDKNTHTKSCSGSLTGKSQKMQDSPQQCPWQRICSDTDLSLLKS